MNTTFELKCEECGFKTGEITLPNDTIFDVSTMTVEDFGIQYVRCDDHPIVTEES